MIGNLGFIKERGIEKFLQKQEEIYKCLECQGVICVHTSQCDTCGA